MVPWIEKFHTSASGAPLALVTLSTTISESSGRPRRLSVTGGAARLIVATSAGTRAPSACRITAAADSTSASRTTESRRSDATTLMRPESRNAPGPECVWDAETMSVVAGTPAAARRS